MEKFFLSGLALSAIIALVGCGGGDSNNIIPPLNNISTTSTGMAADGYFSGSTVCFDMDKSATCDEGEPITLTDKNGFYTLKITQAQKDEAKENAPLLLSGGIDIDSKSALIGTLSAPFTTKANANITPLTTMAYTLVNDKNISIEEAYSKVGTALGLTAEEVQSDPVKEAKENKNTKVIEATMALNRIVTMLSESSDDTTPKDIYGALSDTINDVNNSNVGDIIATAANDTNSTFPETAKEAAKIAPLISKQISKAIEAYPESLSDAALVSDSLVGTIKKGIESNTSIEDINSSLPDIASIDTITIALENTFNSYGITLTDSQKEILKSKGGFTSSSEITVDKLLTIDDSTLAPVIENLQNAYTKEEIKSYVLTLGHTLAKEQIDKIASLSEPAFSSTMTVQEFSELIYTTDDTTLMSLALEISPLDGYATLSDVQKAKDLMTSLRTQVNSVSNSSLTGYTDTESVKINDTLNSVAINVEFTSYMFDMLNKGIKWATDTNQTTISGTLSSTRDFILTKDMASSDISWSYDINQSNGTHWKGTLTYPDIYSDTVDLTSVSSLHALFEGTLPLDYKEIATEGISDSQTIKADLTLTKTATTVDLTFNASIDSNGDSIEVTNVKATSGYTTDALTGEAVPTYIKLNNFSVAGKVGDYELDGKIDINAYTQNKLMADAGGIEIETVYSDFGIMVGCSNYTAVNFDPDIKGVFTYDSKEYLPLLLSTGTYGLSFEYRDIDANLTKEDVEDLSNYDFSSITCVDSNESLKIMSYNFWWKDSTLNNSGYLPSNIGFHGKLTNSVDESSFEGTITAVWLDAVDANLSAKDYEPKLNVLLDGKLQMPSSPLMSVSLEYNNNDKNIIKTTYIYDDLSVTAQSEFETSELENGTINITASNAIKSTIVLIDGNIDYLKSSLTNNEGLKLGTYADIAGVPSIRYIDGSFESLP